VKFVIAGAGAIGGYIGAKLARAGADVVLFARGAHLQAMQERGVRVTGADEEFEVRPAVTGDLATAGQADVVILGVKAHALTALAPTLTPLFGPDTIVVSTQNGIPWWYFEGVGGELDGLRLERVDPGGVIAAAIDHRRVVGSLAYFATDLAGPGVIRHIEGNRLSLGEPDGSKSERAKRLAEALIARQRGVQPHQRADPRHPRRDGASPGRLTPGPAADGGNRGRRRQARHRAADLDRPADGRRREGRRAQDLDAAGLRGRTADGARGGGRGGGGAGRSPRRADALDPRGLRLREAAGRASRPAATGLKCTAARGEMVA
jgi:predicted dinucleotide-binding enzyme